MMKCRLLCNFLLVSLSVSSTHATHSRRRPVVIRREVEPRYDRSITTFSSDGRLQQVEYGLEASRRGDPVVAIAFPSMACISVNSSDKVHRIDAHIIMVTCGLVGDGRFLASSLRSACQRFRLSNGEAPTLQEAARMAADFQHHLTRRPGARPLGCTAILAGVEGGTTVRLFQTDPGGIMEECHYCAAGKGQDKAMTLLQKLSGDLKASSGDERKENVVDITRVTQGVANVALNTLEEKDAASHVDVWILQGEIGRRGDVRLTCVQKVKQKNLSYLKDCLSKQEHSATTRNE
jgi:20S proteasome alpha/beta subunit